MSRCYVYALTDSPAPRLRIAGRAIESIASGAVYAAVVRTDALPPVSEEALQEQHAIVAKLAARVRAILPMRFGALMEEDDLERILAANHAAILAALDLVRGREQMTVRVIGPAPVAPAVPAAAETSGTEYLRRRRDVIHPRDLPAAAAVVRQAVSSIVAAERVEAGEGNVHATLWHLIDRGNAARYRDALERIAAPTSPLQLIVSGPWAPFAFAPELHS